MRRVLLVSLALVLAAGAALGRNNDGGASGGEFLRYATGARAAAMGDAGTAWARGVASLHYNPATLGWVERGEVEALYQDMVMGIGQGSMGLAHPWGDFGGWGVGLTYLDYGSTSRTTVTTTGGVTGAATAGTFDGSDFAAGFSYGQRFGHGGQWAVGGTLKGISSSIDDADATAFGADLGLAWRSLAIPLELGVTMKNLGTSLEYDRTGEELPLLVRAGGSYRLFENRLLIALEVEAAREESARLLAGAEYWIADLLAVRVGYDGRSADVDDGLTVGGGVRYEDLAVDYAYTPWDDLGGTHRIGLRYRFGGERPAGD